MINVTASVDSHANNAQDILKELKAKILPQLIADYPRLSFDMEGEEKERAESMGSMLDGFKLALLMIFALLAIPFRSYSQPLLIMAAIPFGMVGAVVGHIIMGFDLSLLSLFGLVALSGVVVNDSLLLIDRANRNRCEGMGLRESLVAAGTRRFRPIILTSLTTFCGLMPIMLGGGTGSEVMRRIAAPMVGGMASATLLTLVVIPAVFLIWKLRGVKDSESNI